MLWFPVVCAKKHEGDSFLADCLKCSGEAEAKLESDIYKLTDQFPDRYKSQCWCYLWLYGYLLKLIFIFIYLLNYDAGSV